ncbi:Multiple inositol polyphosphate phosphatase 1 [Frankliniella fusca]|uniref:Multiple inositol polyphosphate phosphatase 1 n=1 Tax=Frankliniella fusca TaxID=407009 RepID=A0AAE1HZV8_9NEOP|nr:Multiple inositol polyphosphate phosphatase 1 [Frankliniella fusca]
MELPLLSGLYKMYFFLVKVFLVLLLYNGHFSVSTSVCHSGSKIVNVSLATKTPYRFVANKDDSPFEFEGCKPLKFWSMIRHGTRYPSVKIIKRMNDRLPVLRDLIVKVHEDGRGNLCEGEIHQLLKWTPQLKEEDEKKLTHEGEDELLELGERFQKRFPELLPETYSNSSYKFQFTATQRAEQSARSFTIGLFGRKVSRHVWFPEGIYKDPILRFYKLCENWRKSVDKNPEASRELERFSEGQEMKNVQGNVTERLGFANKISLDDLSLIYVTCSFETAWYPKKQSPWCSLLSDNDFKVLEYAEDLDYYWIDGYGHAINHQQACPTIKDMFSFFSSSNLEKKAVLYFSHSGTVLKMLAHLGLYRDPKPLRASNFPYMLQNRQWRVSQISSFASNIAFVLYKCGSEANSEEKILTLHQERPVRLAGCPPEEDLCSLETFKKVFSMSIQDCNFQSMCSLKS